ncbi:hypothetical protein QF037_000152 [Streptomyces canus]|uniref:SpoIIE family protein phosphatase n=1 Tax=Streptomyces canus TaxID=58343 RepID=UPI0027809C73|nr:SpoIIE family protein phosphatase [Streptomyces canus]MDQ0595807.1 hypothetical protein [Streptomyces canus]
MTRTAEELAEPAVTGFADCATVDLLESAVQGHEPQAIPPATPVVCRRTAQCSVLPECPESVVPAGGPDVCAPSSPPAAALTPCGRSAAARLGHDGASVLCGTDPRRRRFAPGELLTRLDDLMVRLDREEGPDARGASKEAGATCLYAVYAPVAGRCDLARAAHPRPDLVTSDGTVRVPDLSAGPPLGLGGLPFEAARMTWARTACSPSAPTD